MSWGVCHPEMGNQGSGKCWVHVVSLIHMLHLARQWMGGDGIVRSMPVFLVRRRSAATPCVAPASGLSPAGPSAMGSSDSIPATAAECDLSDNPNHGHWLRCQAPAVGLRPSFWGENPSRWCLLCWPSLCSRSPDLFSMGIRVFGFFNKDQRVEYKSQNN